MAIGGKQVRSPSINVPAVLIIPTSFRSGSLVFRRPLHRNFTGPLFALLNCNILSPNAIRTQGYFRHVELRTPRNPNNLLDRTGLCNSKVFAPRYVKIAMVKALLEPPCDGAANMPIGAWRMMFASALEPNRPRSSNRPIPANREACQFYSSVWRFRLE